MCKYFLISIIILLTTSLNLEAQENEILKTRIRLNYQKDFTKEIVLVAELTVKLKRYNSFEGAEVNFYNLNDSSKVLVDKLKTNEEGIAKLVLPKDFEIYKDEEGLMSFEVEFEGNDSCRGSSTDLSVKEAGLDLAFFQKDSLKFIEIIAMDLSTEDEGLPLSGVNISFYVKGTFSLLKFIEKKTDESGKAKIEFPIDIPGDTVGVVKIVAKIDDNEDYGTVNALGVINWAIPIQPSTEISRGLGDTDAPLWMVYTLIILLSAVWFHYLFVIYQIVRIKLEEKKDRTNLLPESKKI